MAQPGSTKGAQPKTQPKTVEIRVNTDGTCSPDPAKAYSIDRIMWVGDVNDLHFPNDNPFDDGKDKKFKPNFAYKISKSNGKFKYNAITPTGSYDPDIEVEPPPH
jgi:hypothetical protein